MQEAAKSIAFYRRLDVNSNQVKAELDKIKKTMDPKLETLLQEKEFGQELGKAKNMIQLRTNFHYNLVFISVFIF